jgi:serpin B
MMRMTDDFRHMSDRTLGFEAASIPYKAMSMLVILPDAGKLAAVEELLVTTLLDRISRGLAMRRLELGLPKFDLKCRYDLAGPLAALGVQRLFRTDAELGGITDDPAGLYVSSVVHEASITVDENGTEAAAATAMMMIAGAAFQAPPKPHPFIVDRPFLFVIWDEPTQTVLFAGRVVDPS